MASQIKYITSPKTPPVVPTYTPAVVYNGMVYCSGVLGIDPKTREVIPGTIGDRTIQCLKNLTYTLEEAGSCKENILKLNIYVTNIKDVPAMNRAYDTYFAEPRPARCTVEVAGLARGTDVEIECIGFVNKSKL